MLNIVLFFAVFLILALHTKAHAASTAEESVREVQQAIDTGDEALFDSVVDMESLVGQCVDVFLEDADKVDQKTLPAMLAIMLSAVNKSPAAKEKLRSTLMKEVSEYIRFGVRSGAYAGKMQSNAKPPKGLLSGVFSTTFMSRKEITHVGEGIPESGAVYVSSLLKDYGTGEYPVEFWLREQGGTWRIVGIRNVRTLVRMLQEGTTVQSI